jgi:hypothetical protein
MTRLTNSQHSNHTNPGYSNRVRVHAAHDCEHGCHDSSTFYRGCTHFPWVVIILGSQVSIDPMEYLYKLLGCVLGYHYKAFQWLNLICSAPAKVSPELSVQITKGPLLCRVVLRRVHSLTHSFPTRLILGASLNPHLSYPVPRKREWSLHTCAQDVQITRTVTIW